MQITNEELGSLFNLFREMQTTKVDRHEYEMWEQIRRENRNFVEMLHFIKMQYPEAIEAWNALQKIGE